MDYTDAADGWGPYAGPGSFDFSHLELPILTLARAPGARWILPTAFVRAETRGSSASPRARVHHASPKIHCVLLPVSCLSSQTLLTRFALSHRVLLHPLPSLASILPCHPPRVPRRPPRRARLQCPRLPLESQCLSRLYLRPTFRASHFLSHHHRDRRPHHRDRLGCFSRRLCLCLYSREYTLCPACTRKHHYDRSSSRRPQPNEPLHREPPRNARRGGTVARTFAAADCGGVGGAFGGGVRAFAWGGGSGGGGQQDADADGDGDAMDEGGEAEAEAEAEVDEGGGRFGGRRCADWAARRALLGAALRAVWAAKLGGAGERVEEGR
ncbi:hypothetical protein B0H16DRAFT_1616022, partial [Mycena metata]